MKFAKYLNEEFEIKTVGDLRKLPIDQLKKICRGNKIVWNKDWEQSDFVEEIVGKVGEDGMKLLNQYVGRWKSGPSGYVK
jgi:hypothetical protein